MNNTVTLRKSLRLNLKSAPVVDDSYKAATYNRRR